MHIVQQQPKECKCGRGGGGAMWDENQITLFLWLRERKQAEAHVQAGCLSLPVTLPLPPAWPITAQLLGVWAESKISRTSLYAQPLYEAHKESTDQHKCGWGQWVETKQKERMDVPPPHTHTLTTKRKWELVYFGSYCNIFILKGRGLVKVTMWSLQSNYTWRPSHCVSSSGINVFFHCSLTAHYSIWCSGCVR